MRANCSELESPRPLFRRATDVLGIEIVRFVLDDANRIRFVRASVDELVPELLRWPCGIGYSLLDRVPAPQREIFRERLNFARARGEPVVWYFESTVVPGERRIGHAVPVPGRERWVAVAVFTAAQSVPVGSGELIAYGAGLMWPAFTLAQWLFH